MEPRRDKSFLQSEIQTSLLSYRLPKKWKFSCSKLRYGTLQNAINKGAD